MNNGFVCELAYQKKMFILRKPIYFKHTYVPIHSFIYFDTHIGHSHENK